MRTCGSSQSRHWASCTATSEPAPCTPSRTASARTASPPRRANVLGVLSLIFWSLVLIVSVKYLAFVLSADNRGEGGILALMALTHPGGGGGRRPRHVILLLGLFGAALLYGDGVITPAISVLGAVEGLTVRQPSFAGWIVPLAIVILVGLFLLQQRGTGGVGAIFGPVMFVWFAAIAVLGLAAIVSSSRSARSHQPLAWGRLLRAQPCARIPDPGLRVPDSHRSRSAVRRHGPFRRPTDPARLVHARAARFVAELLRAGSAAAA